MQDADSQPTGPRSPSALSAVPAAGIGRSRLAGGAVKFFYGPMDCGKSTLALQLDHNHASQGRHGLLLTRLDRSGPARISSRMGLSRPAVEVDDDMDLGALVRRCWAQGRRVDYVIVDEAQFFTPVQVEQLAQLADDAQVDIYAFGIATDFRGRLFAGSARLFELADAVLPLQVEVLCWCGRIGRFNGRVIDGHLVRDGATVLVADTVPVQDGSTGASPDGAARSAVQAADVTGLGNTRGDASDRPTVRYQVLCRAHHRSGQLGPDSAAE
jgi:thymidine kinase